MKSIKTKIAAALGLMGFFFALHYLIVFTSFQHILKNPIHDHLYSMAHDALHHMDTYLADNKNDMGFLARQLTQTHGSMPSLTSTEPLDHFVKTYKNYWAVMVIDKKGAIITASRLSPLGDVLHPPIVFGQRLPSDLFKETLLSLGDNGDGRPLEKDTGIITQISRTLPNRNMGHDILDMLHTPGKETIIYTARLRDHTKETIGFIMGFMDIGSLQKSLTYSQKSLEKNHFSQARLWLADRTQRILLKGRDEDPKNVLTPRTPRAVSSDHDILLDFHHETQDPLLRVSVRSTNPRAIVADLGWTLFLTIPTEQAYQSLSNLFVIFMIAGIGIVFIMICLGWFMGRVLVQPIFRMRQSIMDYDIKNHHTVIPILNRQDEIGDLSKAFHYLGTELHHAYRTIDQKVAFKTQALTHAKDDLENALRDLKNAQKQIIMTHKMQFIGSLTKHLLASFVKPLAAMQTLRDKLTSFMDRLMDTVHHEDVPAKTKKSLNDTHKNLTKIHQDMFAQLDYMGIVLERIKPHTDVRESSDIAMVSVDKIITETYDLHCQLIQNDYPDFVPIFIKNFDDNLPTIKADEHNLRIALGNIIDVALQSMADKKKKINGGTVYGPIMEITIHARDDRLDITLHDNGMGLDHHAKEHLFDFDPGSPQSEIIDSVGLAVSHDIIVYQHQGALRVESEDGKFTAFIITLPL